MYAILNLRLPVPPNKLRTSSIIFLDHENMGLAVGIFILAIVYNMIHLVWSGLVWHPLVLRVGKITSVSEGLLSESEPEITP